MRGVLVILLFSLSPYYSWSQEGYMTLDQCVEYGLKNNENTKITALNKLKSNAEISEIIARAMPQVEFKTFLNYNLEPQKSLIDISTLDPNVPKGTEQEVTFQQDYDGNLAFTLNQLIFDGSFFVGLEASRTYKTLISKKHIETEIDVVASVSKAYYTVIINNKRLALIQKNRERIDSILSQTQVLYDNGFAEKLDVDRLKITYNNVLVEENKLSRLRDVSMKMLKFQMGMPFSENLYLSDTTLNVNENYDAQLGAEIDIENRIEYSQLKINERLLQLDIKNYKAQYLPKVYASINYGYNTATSNFDLYFKTNRWLNFSTVGVDITIPIFDGLTKSFIIQQRKIDLQEIELRKQMLSKNIDLEKTNAENKLKVGLENLKVQKSNLALSREVYETTRIKYLEGVGSNLELLQADSDRKEAETHYFSALYDVLIAQIELKKALGILYEY